MLRSTFFHSHVACARLVSRMELVGGLKGESDHQWPRRRASSWLAKLCSGMDLGRRVSRRVKAILRPSRAASPIILMFCWGRSGVFLLSTRGGVIDSTPSLFHCISYNSDDKNSQHATTRHEDSCFTAALNTAAAVVESTAASSIVDADGTEQRSPRAAKEDTEINFNAI